MKVEQARRLIVGSTVSIQGRGGGHEPIGVFTRIVTSLAHQKAEIMYDIHGNTGVWVNTDDGVWASTRFI